MKEAAKWNEPCFTLLARVDADMTEEDFTDRAYYPGHRDLDDVEFEKKNRENRENALRTLWKKGSWTGPDLVRAGENYGPRNEWRRNKTYNMWERFDCALMRNDIVGTRTKNQEQTSS